MASEQQLTNLNDEIEQLKVKKKKLRELADSREAEIVSKERDISNLEREIKSLLKVSILTIYITVLVTRGRHFGARESV
jgi:predicted  nucleic acid-binding Zn-ribbon protein